MDQIKKEIKENISILIEKGLYERANQIIEKYEAMAGDDIDMFSFKAVINILNGDYQAAENHIEAGLKMDHHNVDLLCNLAHINEARQNNITAYKLYRQAHGVCQDPQTREMLHSKLEELNQLEVIQKHAVRKKVLVIAHIFPPVGGSGVQRTLKFIKYLRSFGWEPIVVTVGHTHYPLKDESLCEEVDKDIEVIRFDEPSSVNNGAVQELIKLYDDLLDDKALLNEYINLLNNNPDRLEQILFIPDFYIMWGKEVLKNIEQHVNFNEIDLIYSTSGPYSDHAVAYLLKQKYNKPWIIDFRDEWTNNPMAQYNRSSIQYKIDHHLENKFLSHADHVVVAAPIMRDNYVKLFNVPSSKITSITNGYDEADFDGIHPEGQEEGKFSIIHNGLLYGNRTPITFINCISNLIKTGKIQKDKLIIYFTHTDNDDTYIEYVKKLGLEDNIRFIGYLSHRESLVKASSCHLLLIITGEGPRWYSVYTGKVFEYLRLSKPILSLSPKGSVLEKLIKKTERGRNVEYHDVKGMEKFVFEMYRKWEEGALPTLKLTDEVQQFERKGLTEKLASIFDEELKKEYSNLSQQYKKQMEADKKILMSAKESLCQEELLLKQHLEHDSNNEKLLFGLGQNLLNQQRYYESYRFFKMAEKTNKNKVMAAHINKIQEQIYNSNLHLGPFKRTLKYNFILAGDEVTPFEMGLLTDVGNIKGVLKEYKTNQPYQEISMNSLEKIQHDYVIVLSKDRNKAQKIIDDLAMVTKKDKIYDFHNYPYHYFIEGFETKLNEFLKKSKIEFLITGLSYAEVGINAEEFPYSAFNFALSSQDLYYDYHLTKYLLSYDSVKNHIKKLCICISYYAFDYDLSSILQNSRIHRYYYELGKTNRYDNILHLRLCHSLYKKNNYEEDYINYHHYKLNTVLNKESIKEEEAIAMKQAQMNYPDTVKENKILFDQYLKLLKEHNIEPVIVILPTSKYYHRQFANQYQKNKFYNIMNEFQQKYSFKVLDYFDSREFADQDFWDTSHLNKKGASKFTNILKEELF